MLELSTASHSTNMNVPGEVERGKGNDGDISVGVNPSSQVDRAASSREGDVLTFRNIEIHGQNIATPLFIKLGNRVDGEDHKGHWSPGSISDVNFSAIRAVGWGHVSNPKSGHGTAYTATIEGLNASHRVGPFNFKGIEVVAPGGGTVEEALIDPPMSPLDYQPRYNGVRPSWGLFVRYVRGLTVVSSSLVSASFDGRPAMVVDQVHALVLSNVAAHGVNTHGCQLAYRNSSGNWTDASACVWTPRGLR